MNKNIMKVLGLSLVIGVLATGCQSEQPKTETVSEDKVYCTLSEEEQEDLISKINKALKDKGTITLYESSYDVPKEIYNKDGEKVTIKIPCDYGYSTNLVKADVVFDCRASEPTLYIETHRPAFSLKVNVEESTLDGKLLKDVDEDLYKEVKALVSNNNRISTYEYCEDKIEDQIDMAVNNYVYNKEMKTYKDIIMDIDPDIYDKTPVEIFEISIP